MREESRRVVREPAAVAGSGRDRVVRGRNLRVEEEQAVVDLERAEQRQARPEVALVGLCFEPKHWLLVYQQKYEFFHGMFGVSFG